MGQGVTWKPKPAWDALKVSWAMFYQVRNHYLLRIGFMETVLFTPGQVIYYRSHKVGRPIEPCVYRGVGFPWGGDKAKVLVKIDGQNIALDLEDIVPEPETE